MGVDHDLAEADAACGGRRHERPEDDDVGGDDEQQTPDERPLAEARRVVLELVQPRAPGHEPIDGPPHQPEEPQFLARRRIDGQPIGVVGIALCAAHLVRVAVPARRALSRSSQCVASHAPASSGGAHHE